MKSTYTPPTNVFRPIVAIFVSMLLLMGTATTQAAEVDDNLQNYFELLRSDFNSAKVKLVNGIMKLSEADAKKFWPVYREYESELGKLSTDRARLITEFVQSNTDGKFDDEAAKDQAKRYFKAQKKRLALLEKYHGKIQKLLSPVRAAQFLQIENQIFIFIDFTIASEMPMVGEKPTSK